MYQGTIMSVFRNMGKEFYLIESDNNNQLLIHYRSTPKLDSKRLKIGDRVLFKINYEFEDNIEIKIIKKHNIDLEQKIPQRSE